ncbi:MAG: polysaccharide pyruvyl transferase family protein, partial [Planctomycetota bacterium]
ALGDRGRYLLGRALGKAMNRVSRRATATPAPDDAIAVIGAFHGRNVGDMALGSAVRQALEGRPARLIDIHRLEEFQPFLANRPAIVAGGATGVRDNVTLLREYYGKAPERLAIVGWDVAADVPEWAPDEHDFLRSVAFLGLRDEAQAELLRDVLSRPDVTGHPDNAFSLLHDPAFARHTSADRRDDGPIGLNLLPLFMSRHGARWETGTALEAFYRRIGSPLADAVHTLGPAYVRAVRAFAEAQDRPLVHLPFAPEDDLIARSALRGLDVKFEPYDADPARTFAAVAECAEFLSTRFHATVFALIAGTPCHPVLYAAKCEALLADCGLKGDEGAAVTRADLIADDGAAAERLIAGRPLRLADTSERDRLAAESAAALSAAVRSVIDV